MTDAETIPLPSNWSLRLDDLDQDQPWAFYNERGLRLIGYCQLRVTAEKFAAAMNAATLAPVSADPAGATELAELSRKATQGQWMWSKSAHSLRAHGEDNRVPLILSEGALTSARQDDSDGQFAAAAVNFVRQMLAAALARPATAPGEGQSSRIAGGVPDELVELSAKATSGTWSWEDGPPTVYAGRVDRRGTMFGKPTYGHGLNLFGRLTDCDSNGPANLDFVVGAVNFIRQQIALAASPEPPASAGGDLAEVERLFEIALNLRDRFALNVGRNRHGYNVDMRTCQSDAASARDKCLDALRTLAHRSGERETAALEQAALWHERQIEGGHCGEDTIEIITRQRVNSHHRKSAEAIRALKPQPPAPADPVRTDPPNIWQRMRTRQPV